MATFLRYAVSLFMLKTQIDIFFVIYLEIILMHAYRTFSILNFGRCIMKIDNIWRKLWLNNIKRCFWQIFKITVGMHMFCYIPENHCKLTNSQKWLLLCKTHLRSKFETSWHLWITALKIRALNSRIVQGD